jgi:adenylate cyclase
MTIRIQLANATQRCRFDHANGPLEFGRGPQRDVQRVRVDDVRVSRDHLRVEQLSADSVRLDNLSTNKVVRLGDGTEVEPQRSLELRLPLAAYIGQTALMIEAEAAQAVRVAGSTLQAADGMPADGAPDAAQPIMATVRPLSEQPRVSSRSLNIQPTTAVLQKISDCLKTVIELQEAAVGSPEFYQRTAQAVIDVAGLDLGLVLLRGNPWTIAGSAFASDTVPLEFSRMLVDYVTTRRQTFYQDLDHLDLPMTASLATVEAAVATPIFGVGDEVVGVLYGVRHLHTLARGGIQPLEAQLVQLLAVAVGGRLARATALKTKLQFEQFFSPDLVRELQQNPNLLEGRVQEVTVLFSDLRGFTALSERLGAESTCRMLRDMMEHLSTQIVERGGAIVDYAGDGILAMWNAPVAQEDHVVRACRAAVGMLDELPDLNRRWQDEIDEPLTLGIGINIGQALIGNTGSSRKFKYGPHGHTVNLASRLQDVTKKLRLAVVISDNVRDRLPAGFHTRRLGKVRLPGVKEPVVLFELQGEQASDEWLALRETYERALALYEAGQWTLACQTLLPLLSLAEKTGRFDAPTVKLMRQAWECFESQPATFDAILEVNPK